MNARLLPPARLDRDLFSVTDRDGLSLVTPSKRNTDLMNVSAWDGVSPWLRSAVLDSDTGEVRSVGFQKFWNLGQQPGDEDRLTRLLGRDDVRILFTEKLDGSLAIRSVIDGQVTFRTRGTFDGGDHGPAIRSVAAARYPVLLDPAFEPDHSLLFEFVHPAYRIVIAYEQPDLILLGRVDHRDLSHTTYPNLVAFAAEHGLRAVGCHELPRDVAGLLDAVGQWEGAEGVVVRVEQLPVSDTNCGAGGVWLVKVKSADYLIRHRLRFNLTARTVRAMCEARKVTTPARFERALADIGGDWEMAEQAGPLVDAFIAAWQEAAEHFRALRGDVLIWKAHVPTRKDFAVEYANSLPSVDKGPAFLLYDGRNRLAWQKVLAGVLDRAFGAAQRHDDELVALEA